MAQGTYQHTPPVWLKPQPKVTRASVVSTAKRQLCRQESQPAQGLHRPRTSMGPQDTGVHSGRRGGRNPQESARGEGSGIQRDRGDGPPRTVARA